MCVWDEKCQNMTRVYEKYRYRYFIFFINRCRYLFYLCFSVGNLGSSPSVLKFIKHRGYFDRIVNAKWINLCRITSNNNKEQLGWPSLRDGVVSTLSARDQRRPRCRARPRPGTWSWLVTVIHPSPSHKHHRLEPGIAPYWIDVTVTTFNL